MTAKEKAKELINKFYQPITINLTEVSRHSSNDIWEWGKQCALICVDEILNAHFMKRDSGHKTFWINVQSEIKNL